MRVQSETMVSVDWKSDAEGVAEKKVLEQEWLRHKSSERRDTYRFGLENCYPVKMIMIINDLIIKKGMIKELSAGGFSCDFLEPTALPLRQKTNVRFRLDMDNPVIIKSEAIYQGAKDNYSMVHRLEFSDKMSEGERDSIHQFILIKQLEIFRSNRRKILDD